MLGDNIPNLFAYLSMRQCTPCQWFPPGNKHPCAPRIRSGPDVPCHQTSHTIIPPKNSLPFGVHSATWSLWVLYRTSWPFHPRMGSCRNQKPYRGLTVRKSKRQPIPRSVEVYLYAHRPPLSPSPQLVFGNLSCNDFPVSDDLYIYLYIFLLNENLTWNT